MYVNRKNHVKIL